jgi:5'-3' exonuclease
MTHLIVTQVLSFANKFGASKENKMVLCLDSHSWRYEYFDTNKLQFPEFRELKYKDREKDPTIPWKEIKEAIHNVCMELKAHSDYYVLKVDGAEADDIIAVLADTFKDIEPVWIVSADKDFVQLQVENKVAIYDPLKNAFKPEVDVKAFKKIHCIAGDKSDSIPAIKARVAEKTAIKMLPDLRELLQTNPDMRAKYIFNQNLIDFDFIPVHIKEAILEDWKDQDFNFNVTGLMKAFMKYRLAEHSSNINAFKLSTNKIDTNLNQFFVTRGKNDELAKNTLEDFFS